MNPADLTPASVPLLPARPLRRWLRRLAWVAVIGIVVLGLTWGILLLLATRALDAEIAAIERAGQPTRFEQVIPAAVPAETNAALRIERSLLLMASPESAVKGLNPWNLASEWQALKGDWTIPGRSRRALASAPSEVTNPKPSKALAQALREASPAERQAILDLLVKAPWWPPLVEAASLPAVRFSLDYDNEKLPVQIMLPYINGISDQTRLAILKAVLHASEGQGGEALRSLGVAASLTRQLGLAEPLFTILPGMASFWDVWVANGIEEVCAFKPIATEAEWQTLTQALERPADLSPALLQMLDVTLAWQIASIPYHESWLPHEIIIDDKEFSFWYAALCFRPLLRWNNAKNLRQIARMRTALVAGADQVELNRMKLDDFLSPVNINIDISRVENRLQRSRAQLRLAQAAIACERYRMKHGARPEQLEQLAPGQIPAGITLARDAQGLVLSTTVEGMPRSFRLYDHPAAIR